MFKSKWKLIWEDEGTWILRQPSAGDLESNIKSKWKVHYKIYLHPSKGYKLETSGSDAINHKLYKVAVDKLNEYKKI